MHVGTAWHGRVGMHSMLLLALCVGMGCVLFGCIARVFRMLCLRGSPSYRQQAVQQKQKQLQQEISN